MDPIHVKESPKSFQNRMCMYVAVSNKSVLFLLFYGKELSTIFISNSMCSIFQNPSFSLVISNDVYYIPGC